MMGTHAQLPNDDDYEQIRDELFIPYRPQPSTVNNPTDDEAEQYLLRDEIGKEFPD